MLETDIPQGVDDLREAETLRQELDAATKRIRDLEVAVSRADERFNAFTSTLPGISWETWGRPDEVAASYVSPSVEAITGYGMERWQSQAGFWLELVHPDDKEKAKREIQALAAGNSTEGVQEYRWILANGEVIWMHVRFTILRDESNEPVVWQAFSLDVTAQKMAEIERDKLLGSQALLLAQLSTPLIPITDDIVVMPLIGPIDQARANQVLEVLLRGLASQRARFAIVDVTGVPAIDEDVVHALTRVTNASRLLGVDVLLTGIRAEVAQAFCKHGDDLAGMSTCANLKHGIAQAMRRGRRR
ncbi:MAG: PAS domain-containing protein [Polyangiaceae bacterium]|nr:PAS domain-containing protein [Polyangiaceae bacterium]